mgnify:CR=1 FL=1|jgi:hypothetical protein
MITMSPWQQMLVGIMPDYLKYKKLTEEGPELLLTCYKKGNYWYIRIEEELYGADRDMIFPLIDQLPVIIDWATEQLVDWPNVRRTSYDTWQFRRKRDTEKFQVLYNLTHG